MKKVLLVAVAGMFVLASCKKDYNCECTINFLGTSTTQTTVLKDVKKKDATAACDAGDMAGISSCEIK
jgi:hypothetical protein